MEGAKPELPDDVEALKAIIAQLESKLSWAEEKVRALELRYFGRKSEKYSPEEDKQKRLFDEAEAHADGDAALVAEKIEVPAHERKKRGRKPKADNLPVREELHELPAAERACPCCGEALPEIGEERSAEYDLVPAHVVKIVHPCPQEVRALLLRGLPRRRRGHGGRGARPRQDCAGLGLHEPKLFDDGYITVTTDFRVEVSKAIREEYNNGKIYYAMHGARLSSLPASSSDLPSGDFLSWHNENVFKAG